MHFISTVSVQVHAAEEIDIADFSKQSLRIYINVRVKFYSHTETKFLQEMLR